MFPKSPNVYVYNNISIVCIKEEQRELENEGCMSCLGYSEATDYFGMGIETTKLWLFKPQIVSGLQDVSTDYLALLIHTCSACIINILTLAKSSIFNS